MADKSLYYDATTDKFAFKAVSMTFGHTRNYIHVSMGIIIPVHKKPFPHFSPNADFTKELAYYHTLIGKQFYYKYKNGNHTKPVTITDVDDLVYLDRVPCFRLYYTK